MKDDPNLFKNFSLHSEDHMVHSNGEPPVHHKSQSLPGQGAREENTQGAHASLSRQEPDFGRIGLDSQQPAASDQESPESFTAGSSFFAQSQKAAHSQSQQHINAEARPSVDSGTAQPDARESSSSAQTPDQQSPEVVTLPDDLAKAAAVDPQNHQVPESDEVREARLALQQAAEARHAADRAKDEGNFLYQWRANKQAEKISRMAEKKAIKVGLMEKPSCFTRLRHGTRRLMRWAMRFSVVGAAIFIGLFFYFDAMVIDQYEVDDKWVLPAVVYSRPLELYPDQRLSLDQMLYELKLLKYREVASPRNPGEYAVNKRNGRIVLIKRPFVFPDIEEAKMSVLVEFDDKRVKRILNAETKQDLSFMRMDPVLLDRINRINPEEDRIFITLDEVPQDLITTLVEVEDRSYYKHFGINPVAIIRAFVKNFIAGGVVEGGSTITQQLVKNYFLTSERSYSRKIKEIFMAIAMNHRYTKDQILEAYMNEIYLGQNGRAGIYGFGLASYFYFGVPVSELNLGQIALLVGLIKGPSYYDPWRHPENALSRRNVVLSVLYKRGHISRETMEEEQAKPLNIIPRGQMNYSRTPAFMGLVKTEIGTRFKEEEERTGKDFLSGNGIRIFTSLDPQAQAAAELAVSREIKAIEQERHKKNLEAAMIVSSWRTGEVSAVVGSSKPKFDGYNRVLASRRQIGSLMKPFVYLTAYHQGYHLGSIVNDSPVKVQMPNNDIWSPQNDDKKYRGPIRVATAMAKSLNVPTVRIGMGAGLDNVISTIHAAGYKGDIPMYPSIVLGTPEISPYELNSMYVGMATEGIYRDLTTLRTVVKNGEIVYQRGANRAPRTLDPKDTYLAIFGMTEVTRIGTGRKISSAFPGITIASKTGTTNDLRDSWTVGMDADELSTVWVGYDNNKSTGLYGSTGAMRLYVAYLKERGVNSLSLRRPKGVSVVNFDRQGNVLAQGCVEDGMEAYPAREDRIHYVKQCRISNEVYEQSYDSVQIQAQPQAQAPDHSALQGTRVYDSGARDFDPIKPESTDRPVQQSSQAIESQADSFEDSLLGL